MRWKDKGGVSLIVINIAQRHDRAELIIHHRRMNTPRHRRHRDTYRGLNGGRCQFKTAYNTYPDVYCICLVVSIVGVVSGRLLHEHQYRHRNGLFLFPVDISESKEFERIGDVLVFNDYKSSPIQCENSRNQNDTMSSHGYFVGNTAPR